MGVKLNDLGQKTKWRAFVKTLMTLRLPFNAGESLGQLRNYQLYNDSAPRKEGTSPQTASSCPNNAQNALTRSTF